METDEHQIAPDAGLLAKIGGIAGRAFETAKSTIKPGRGRPRKDGAPKKSDVLVALPALEAAQPDIAPVTAPAAPEDSGLLDAEIIEKICRSVVRGVCLIPEALIRFIASRKKISEASLQASLDKCAPLEAELDVCAKILPILAAKHGIDLAKSPEGILALQGGIILARYGAVAVTIAKLENLPRPGRAIGQPAVMPDPESVAAKVPAQI